MPSPGRAGRDGGVIPFTPRERDAVRARVLELARADPRIRGGAEVGSFAGGRADRWSDLDLTFSVADGTPPAAVLDDFSRALGDELHAVHLFDVPSGPSIYRVFVLPGCLQVDVSVTPEAYFAARGPDFRLLFGAPAKDDPVRPAPAPELFGHAVHHLLRARFAIERGRYWLAEYWLRSTLDIALALECRRAGLPSAYARGIDDLPADLLAIADEATPRARDRTELRRALGASVRLMLRGDGETNSLVRSVEPHLRTLAAEWGAEGAR
jgi:hypothetical protein